MRGGGGRGALIFIGGGGLTVLVWGRGGELVGKRDSTLLREWGGFSMQPLSRVCVCLLPLIEEGSKGRLETKDPYICLWGEGGGQRFFSCNSYTSHQMSRSL